MPTEGSAVRIVGGGETAEVGDIFVKRLLAVQGKVRKRSVAVVLSGESGGSRVEMFKVAARKKWTRTLKRCLSVADKGDEAQRNEVSIASETA